MATLRNKYSSPAYWTQLIQLMLYDNIKKYLDDNKLTQTEFAQKLGVSKGYVSQILNGDFNHRLSKLVELALACDMIPRIELLPKEYAEEIAKNAYVQPVDWKQENRYNGVNDMSYSLNCKLGPTKLVDAYAPLKVASTQDWVKDKTSKIA